jgi:sRNA-binding protein
VWLGVLSSSRAEAGAAFGCCDCSGADRIDLYGKKAGTVTEQEARVAIKQVTEEKQTRHGLARHGKARQGIGMARRGTAGQGRAWHGKAGI